MTMQGQGAYRSADACARCGARIDPSQAAYAAEGMICRGCEVHEGVRDANAAALGSQAGLGALGWGIVSLFCNVLFIPSILAITSGVKDLRALEAPEARQSLAGQYGNIQAKAIIGIVLGTLHPLMVIGAVGLIVLGGIAGALKQPSYDTYAPYDDPYYDTGYGNDPYGYGSDPLYGDPYAPAGNVDPYVPAGNADPYAPTGNAYRDPYAPAGNAYDDPYR